MQAKELPWWPQGWAITFHLTVKLPIVHFQDIKKCNGKLERLEKVK